MFHRKEAIKKICVICVICVTLIICGFSPLDRTGRFPLTPRNPMKKIDETKEKEGDHVFMTHPLFLVCLAWTYSNGCKSLTSPNSGNCIANSKGVHCEVESERSWRQTSDLTYRNFIWRNENVPTVTTKMRQLSQRKCANCHNRIGK